MGQSLFLLCKFEGPNFLISISEGFSYSLLVVKLQTRWISLDDVAFSITYSLPGLGDFGLQNDEDLGNLLVIAEAENIKRVEVFITKVGKIDNIPGPQSLMDVHISDQDVDMMDACSYNGDESDPLSKYCLHKKKQLMSDYWRDIIKQVGQVFEGGAKHFRTELCKYSIEVGFEFIFEYNDNKRVTAFCAYRDEKNCMWRINARKEISNGYFYIRELVNVHTCGATVKKLKNKRMSSDIVASEILEKLRKKPLVSAVDIKDSFKDDYGLDITYNHAWLGVEKARKQLFGDHTLSYDDLRWYVDSTLELNPGSRLEMEYDHQKGHFKRLFVSFEACIQGFNFCRPLLFLDGTFLQGRYKGQLLGATGKDGNNGLFHLAFAIVDSETEDNWHWFLEHLRFVISPGREVTFVSDRNKGLLEAVSRVFPSSSHAFCLRHLKENLKDKLSGNSKSFKDTMLSKLDTCAYTPSFEECAKTLQELRDECDDKVERFLDYAPIENWTNTHFKGRRYGEMTSNAAESFNSWIRLARKLPVMNLVDKIRCQVMDMMSRRRRESRNWKFDFCPIFENKLQRYIEFCRIWEITESTDNVYEVNCIPSVFVNIEARTCTCCKWQLRGFPCCHAVAVILSLDKDFKTYIEEYFHADFFRQSYANGITPIPTLGKPVITPEDAVVIPPLTKKPVGRPQKMKRMKKWRETYKKVRKIICGRCHVKGNHNRTTCNAPLVPSRNGRRCV